MIMSLDIDDQESADSVRMSLGLFVYRNLNLYLTCWSELLQKISSDLNKSTRELFLGEPATGCKC
jgi:hypothetical protein